MQRFTDTISDDEIPELKWQIEARSVKLHYSSMDCSIVRGPLKMRIENSCSNKWRHNSVEQDTECDFENTSCLVHVIPYSDYTFHIKFCRNGTCAKTVRSKSFQTMSEPPNVVRELRIFSKNDSSISIRWMLPYPPTGKLDLYKVTYEEVDNNNNNNKKRNGNFKRFTLHTLARISMPYTNSVRKNEEIFNKSEISTTNKLARIKNCGSRFKLKMNIQIVLVRQQ
jgi:hypothetical protein